MHIDLRICECGEEGLHDGAHVVMELPDLHLILNFLQKENQWPQERVQLVLVFRVCDKIRQVLHQVHHDRAVVVVSQEETASDDLRLQVSKSVILETDIH